MDLETAQTTTTAKLPILKQENRNLFKLAAQTTTNADGTSTSLIPGPVTTEEKVQKKNHVKARNFECTASTQFSTASTQVSTANTQTSIANLSDATVYAFLVNQSNGSQLIHEDLEQIHEDDLEEIDLKWQLALLSMRTRRFFQKIGRNITTIGVTQLDMTSPRSPKRTVNVEETSSKAMVAIDGAGFYWSYMADDEVPTNMALMAFLDSELLIKEGLASVEEQLFFYKKNEVFFCEQLAVLKRDISYKDSEISMLKSELEKLKQEKESNQLKIENFNNASKSLDKLIGSQITDKSRKGYGPKPSKSVSEDTSNEVKESPDAPLVKKLMSDDKLEKKTIFPTIAKIEFVRIKQQEKPVRKPVKYAEMYRSQSPRGNQRNWNNQKSQQLGSNFVMYNKACFICGSFDHVHAHYNYHQMERVESRNNYTRANYNISAKKTHPSAYRNMVLRAVLVKTGLKAVNTVMPVTTAHPKTTVYSARPMSYFSKSAQSTIKRPYQIKTILTNKDSSQKVNTTKGEFYIARQKAVNTARPNSAVVNAVRAN
ncbi:hypothetical protein Tco_0610817 [Tanacetum coccineum]